MKRILILVMVLSLVLVGCTKAGSSSKKGGEIFSGTMGTIEKSDSEKEDNDSEGYVLYNDTYVVTDIIDEEERFVLKSLTNNRQFRFSYGLETSFLDKWGNPTSQTDFVRGSIVTIGKPVDNVLSSMKMDKDAWVVDDLTNFSYDVNKEEFKIGNTKYRIRPTASVFSDDLTMTISDVTSDDRLRVVGIDQEVISVSVTTGHGYIALQNTAFFAGSLITIGTRIHAMLATDTIMSVPAGTYTITVAKDGYGGSTEVNVGKNETVAVDLDTLKGEGPKKCTLTFHVPIDGAHVYVDNKEVSVDQPIEVTYGQHALKVQVKGYDTWEKTLVVNSPSAEITIDPSEDANSSSSSKSSGSSSGSGSGSSSGSGGNTSSTSGSSSESSSESNQTSTSASTSESSQASSESTQSTSSEASESASSQTESSSESSDSSSARTQAELDYLTTLSNMLSQMMNTD